MQCKFIKVRSSLRCQQEVNIIRLPFHLIILSIMKDEQRQALSFEGNYKHFHAALQLTPEEHFLINVENTLTQERYHQLIDQKFISEREILNCFLDPITIFDYLSEHFNDAVIEDGVVKFVYVWGTKVRRERNTAIELVREEMSELQLALLRNDKLAAQLIEKDIKIKTQQQRYRELQINAQRNERRSEAIIKDLQEKVQQLEKQLKVDQKIIQQLDKNLNNELEERKKMSRQSESREKQQIEPENKEKQSPLFHHSDNTNSKFFNLVSTGMNSARLTGLRQNKQFYNFVNGNQILPSQKKKYKIKINFTVNSYIMVGFCTDSGLDKGNNYLNPQSAYYYCSGYFWIAGSKSDNSSTTGIRDVLDCEADLKMGVLRWWKNGSVLKECILPQQMNEKCCYLSVIMFNKGDDVDLSS